MREIQLTQGKVALVDDEDYDLLIQYKWYFSSHGYAVYKTRSKFFYMHRKIMGASSSQLVDHKNFNKLDNRKENLRLCNKAENQRHQRKRANKTTSKYKGVYLNKRNKNWVAQIAINGKSVNLGAYVSEEAAALAYNEAAIMHYKEFAELNNLDHTIIKNKKRLLHTVRIRCDQTGEIFPTLLAAQKKLGVFSSHIRKYLIGKVKTVKGYTFTKIED